MSIGELFEPRKIRHPTVTRSRPLLDAPGTDVFRSWHGSGNSSKLRGSALPRVLEQSLNS